MGNITSGERFQQFETPELVAELVDRGVNLHDECDCEEEVAWAELNADGDDDFSVRIDRDRLQPVLVALKLGQADKALDLTRALVCDTLGVVL